MTTYIPTMTVKDPTRIPEAREILRVLGFEILREETNSFDSKEEEAFKSMFRNVVRDVKSGEIDKQIISDEDFYKELENA